MNNASEVAPPQVYVRCTYCSQSLGHSLLVQNVRNREGKRMNVQTNLSSGGRASGKQKASIDNVFGMEHETHMGFFFISAYSMSKLS